MPYLNLKISGDVSESMAEQAAQALTALTTTCLGKAPQVTSVLIEFIPRAQWFIAGDAVGTSGFVTFYLDVKITSGTNTKDQKTQYVRQAYDTIVALIGNTHPASYVALHELPADAWGYAGETQEFRYVKGRVA